MITMPAQARTACRNTVTGRWRTASPTRLLPLLCFLTVAAAVQAQDYTYETNNGTIPITPFFGSVGALTIPSTINGLPVTSIGIGAFVNNIRLTNVTIPNSVTNIGSAAFEYCEGLTNVTIPSSVTSIGNYAFDFCVRLTNLTIPNSVTSIGTNAFSFCTSLTSFAIPSNVTSIAEGTFAGCTNLISV